MKAIVISPKSKREFEFISSLLEKLNVKSKALSDSDVEDIGLALLLKDVDRSKKISKESIMKKLSN